MTLINWKSKEIYIQEMVAKGEALDMRKSFFNVTVLKKLEQLEKVNEQLTEELIRFQSTKAEIERLAQLTILLSESQREYQMAQNKKPPIERDEVINNVKGLSEEYDITYSEEDGKLYLAYNGKKEDGVTPSEVILQFIAASKYPDQKKATGLEIDRTKAPKGRSALLSGLFYLEGLPVDLMEKLPIEEETKSEEKKIDIGKEMETGDLHLMSFEKKMNLEGMSGKVVASLRAMAKVDKQGNLLAEDVYGLRKENPINIKAPQGLSRTERKEFWDHLRSLYPEAFDKGGNWVGYGRESVDEGSETSKQDPPSVHKKDDTKIKPLTETGAGNGIYSIIDARVDERTVFIGRYFKPKNAYAIASTPTHIGDEESSAMLFCEKERTANFVLEGLLKSPSWQNKIEGFGVHKVSTLSAKIRSDRNRTIYFITNAVTALKALGTQKQTTEPERDVIDAEYEEVKD